jgi:Spy/CpxP family protein refolding chaperone
MGKIQWALVFILGTTLGAPVGAASSNPSAGQDGKAKPTETELGQLPRIQILKKLQLNPKQMDRLYTLRAHYRKTDAELKGKLQVKQVELENELEKTTPDPLKIDQITGDIGVIYGQRIALKAKSNIELEDKILTPDQEEKLKEIELKVVVPESTANPKN